MPKSIFEKIVDGELPSYKVWEDTTFIAFLDINPIVKGHTLVIPKENWGDDIFSLDDKKFQELHLAGKKVAQQIKKAIPCERVVSWVEGFDVPHVHIHLLPVNRDSVEYGINRISLTPTEFEDIQAKITKQK